MSQTKIRKIREANILIESRFLNKDEEDFEYEDLPNEPPSDFEDEEDTIVDYGFDVEEPENDDFQKDMGFKDFMKKNKASSIGIGSGVRWDSESEKEYSPIKPSDMPLEKYLKLKKNKGESEKLAESLIRETYKKVLFEQKMDSVISQLKKELADALTPEQKRAIRKELKTGGLEGLEDELEDAYNDVKSELSEDMDDDDKKLISHHKKSELAGIITILPTLGSAGGIFMKILQGENFEYGIELFALVLSSLVGFIYATSQSGKAEETNKKMEMDAGQENSKIFNKLRPLQSSGELRMDIDGPRSGFAPDNCYSENNPKPEQWKKVGYVRTKTDSKTGKKYISIRYCNSRNLNYLLKQAMNQLDLN